ncbi:sensor histidine kinase [Microbacterium sp. NPDC057659]|uniref:sensor histidine kinase n=1 Tax=Microbacterium sp. NPDC057659 TaxID=3346198 RepID=UPI0036719840
MRTRLRRAAGAIGYSLIGLGAGMISMVSLSVLITGAVLCLVLIGFAVLPVLLRLLARWADANDDRAGVVIGQPRTAARQPHPGYGPAVLRAQLQDPATWRDVRWLAVDAVTATALGVFALAAVGIVLGTIATLALWWALPAGASQFLGVPLTGWGEALGLGAIQLAAGLLLTVVVVLLATPHARMTRRLLTPSRTEVLAERVSRVEETRSGVIDAHGAELRRIERDLHDGAQAQLVALSMRIGLAREADDPETVSRLLAEAHEVAEGAMVELRDVVRTIYPPILVDRGLEGAVRSLATRSAVPVRVRIEHLGQLPAAVEAAAYFVIAEALANIGKHSGATDAEVVVERRPTGILAASVSDDGTGGLDEESGSGLRGIRRRIAALDGTTEFGREDGRTVVRVELPCGS